MVKSLDKLNPNLKSTLAQLGASFGSLYQLAPASAAPSAGARDSEPLLSPEAQALFDVKKDILANVRAATPDGERPTLEQYRLACVDFANSPQGQAMNADKEHQKWTPASYANLEGQDLSGFMLSEPKKISATKEQELAVAESRIQSAIDVYDRDGDLQINPEPVHDFYNHVRFDKADLHGAWVEPATSFNDEIANAKNLEGLTFSGMTGQDEPFKFHAGSQLKNITMRDINGGTIIFEGNTQVDGLDIQGVEAKVEVSGRAAISHITVDKKTRFLTLDMQEGALISNSDLGTASLPPQSNLEGTRWNDVQFGESNIMGVDFDHAKFNGVTFGKTNLKDTNFNNSALNGVTFDGTDFDEKTTFRGATLKDVKFTNLSRDDIASLDLSDVKRFEGVSVNGTSISSPADLKKAQITAETGTEPQRDAPEVTAPIIATKKAMTTTLAAANPNDSLASMAAYAEASGVIAANKAALEASHALLASGIVISKGTEGEIALTTQVASQKRTVPVNEQASGANMQRSAPAEKTDS